MVPTWRSSRTTARGPADTGPTRSRSSPARWRRSGRRRRPAGRRPAEPRRRSTAGSWCRARGKASSPEKGLWWAQLFRWSQYRRAGGIWSPGGSRPSRAPSRDAAIAFPTTCSGSGPSAHGFRHARRAIQCPTPSAFLRLRRRNRPRSSASSCGRCNHPGFVCPRYGLRAGRGGRRSAACRRGGQP